MVLHAWGKDSKGEIVEYEWGVGCSGPYCRRCTLMFCRLCETSERVRELLDSPCVGKEGPEQLELFDIEGN